MRWLIAPVLMVAACSTPDPCAGKSGTCISARVEGNAHDLTQARVTLPDGRVTVTQASSGSIKLPAQFAVLISDNVPPSPFALQLDGLRGGSVVASDTENVTLAGTRGSIKFTLNEGGGGGAGGDGGGGADMAVMNPPVVTGLDPVTVDELAPLSVDMSATDPLGGNVVLSASNLPGNAVFTPNGATGKLTWTPTYTDAGSYTVKITATPDDASRTATFDLVVTVKNAADPIILAGNPVLNAVPIGDWDKDGFGDLAVCTGDAAGATGKYHLQILYGAATGLPLDSASAAGRVDSFDMPATNLGGTLYSCKGGDFDGDGHADIIFSDPANDYWNATMPGSTPNEGRARHGAAQQRHDRPAELRRAQRRRPLARLGGDEHAARRGLLRQQRGPGGDGQDAAGGHGRRTASTWRRCSRRRSAAFRATRAARRRWRSRRCRRSAGRARSTCSPAGR